MLTTFADMHQLTLTLVVTICYQIFFFIIAAACKFDKVTDFAGGTNFVVLAALTYGLGGTQMPRQSLLTACVIFWGVRLSGFLLYRIIVIGEDRRFDGLRENCLKFFGFFLFQMLWVWLVSFPVTFVNTTVNPTVNEARVPFGCNNDYAGFLFIAIGLTCETIADFQKFWFRQDARNNGKWCDAGLWSWSRHPNYFGEIMFWWGVFTVASSTFVAAKYYDDTKWGYVSILSPLFTMIILLFFSGMPVLEAKANGRYTGNGGYEAYRSTTSPLIPMPPSWYASLPGCVRTVCCFEWPMYTRVSAGGGGGTGGAFTASEAIVSKQPDIAV